MRVLFVPLGHRSHLQFQVPLAWAFMAAGHEVRMAGPPDVTDAITGAGITAVAVGGDIDRSPPLVNGAHVPLDLLGMDRIQLGPETSPYAYLQRVLTCQTAFLYQNACPDRMLDELVEYGQWWEPDLVVWDPQAFAGSVVAHTTGAASVRLQYGPDLIGLLRARYLRAAAARTNQPDDPFQEWLGRCLERYGHRFDEQLVLGDLTLYPLPAFLQDDLRTRKHSYRHVPYGGAAEVPRWLRTSPSVRRVCLTLGVTMRETPYASLGLDQLLDAVAGLDVEVVATLDEGQIASVGRLPKNVRAVDYVPLDVLLPTCAAIVHHVGSGTFASALVHGVPQVLVPVGIWDTRLKAELAERAGLGVHLPPETLDAGQVRAALLRVLHEPSHAEAAAHVRDEMATAPTPAELVGVLETFTARHAATRHQSTPVRSTS